MDEEMMHVIAGMRKEMGRWPTEQEVQDFIFSTDPEQKLAILREGKSGAQLMDKEIKEGKCKSCQNTLVQICEDGRPVETYHPAEVSDPKNPCPELIPIPGTSYSSFNVPYTMFEEG